MRPVSPGGAVPQARGRGCPPRHSSKAALRTGVVGTNGRKPRRQGGFFHMARVTPAHGAVLRSMEPGPVKRRDISLVGVRKRYKRVLTGTGQDEMAEIAKKP